MRGEQEALDWLERTLAPAPPGEVWLGDDAAVVHPADGPVLLAADLVVEGVHADLKLVGLDDLGWKAVAVNVSDVAAMGGVPRHLLVSVAGPAGTDLPRLYRGVSAAAAEYGCAVVGGDLSAAPVVVVSVAVTGTAPRPVRRSGAAAGEAVWVTGPLGASAAGLRELRSGRRSGPLVEAHRRPRARVVEGRAAAEAGATAMMDISDGLGIDLGRLARASHVGVVLDRVPVSDGAAPEEALRGGEDYQLVFALPAAADPRPAFAAAGVQPPLRIGRCDEVVGSVRLEGEELGDAGYEHPWGDEA